MLHKLIKEATRHQHDELEEMMYVKNIMDDSLTFEQYKKVLIGNYQITAFYEQTLISALNKSIALRLEIHMRIKINALLTDLHDLHISTETINIPELNEIAAQGCNYILGGLYVLESATLGGNFTYHKLKSNPHLKPLNLSFRYYQVYSEQLISYWKQFCDVINAQPEETFNEVVEGAVYMYDHFIKLQRGQQITNN
ncbi:hypothetical protein A0256_20145 [Mucilaginibacter sp. PAMC 26640]|nr:hypothetical protein A0256_20145 [Mucilaginibacter sp. PAMC 26640]